jgi:pimeloyl-ACP methyl ester carboxylesterase
LLPSLSERPAPDPVFYFVGGPGAAATESAGGQLIALFRRTRDVVFIDQRGTGGSNPLRCQMFGDMASYFTGDVFPAERVRACRAELEKVADLRHYTTPAAMADADEVREALGYERINVSGGSYGSTAALAYLRLYPRRVRTAAVAGVAPIDFKMALPWARGVEQSLERLFKDCAADASCNAAFPALRREFAELYERLGKQSATFEAADATGAAQRITLTRVGLMEHLRAMLYQPSLQSALPLFIHDMHGGSYARFASAAYNYFGRLEAGVARGMHFSVVCAESAPFTTEEEIRRETAGTFYGEARLRAYQRACALWPRGALPAGYLDPAKTDVPVLMISGALDPVTPPWAAAAALPQYTRGRHVVIPNAAHGLDECTGRLLAEFVERGAADNLDASCAAQIRRRPFLTSFPPER